jgi:hypothetical protein
MFLAVPAWIFRYNHAALSAHWILLWALLLYLRTPAGEAPPLRLGVAKLCQLAVGALVTPYHPALAFPIFAASLARSRRWRTVAVWLPLGAAAVALPLWFAGYFSSEIGMKQWGFDQEGANVLAWLGNVAGTPWQWEGYCYLGLGVLGLLVLFLPHARALRGVVRRHRALFAAALACALFALSNRICVGSHELLHYQVPHVLRPLAAQFRSPGRFTWVPMYVLVVYVLHWALGRFGAGRRFAVLVAAAALQVASAWSDWSLQARDTDGPRTAYLDQDAWRARFAAHDAVVVLPSYFCGGNDHWLLSTELELLASERALPINGTYNTRPRRDCEAEARAAATLAPAPGTLYVLLGGAEGVADRLAAGGARCEAFAQGRACALSAGL